MSKHGVFKTKEAKLNRKQVRSYLARNARQLEREKPDAYFMIGIVGGETTFANGFASSSATAPHFQNIPPILMPIMERSLAAYLEKLRADIDAIPGLKEEVQSAASYSEEEALTELAVIEKQVTGATTQ